MKKKNLGSNAFIYPSPVTLIGTALDGKANFMTLAWVARVNSKPPLIGISVNANHYTAKIINDTKCFSINFPTTDMVEKTDYCGIVSGKRIDKSEVFDLFYGELESVPMIKDCSLSLECKLYDSVELPDHIIFIGEVVASHCGEEYLTNEKPDISKMDPLLLTMPDLGYWKVGEFVAKAWSAGKVLKNK